MISIRTAAHECDIASATALVSTGFFEVQKFEACVFIAIRPSKRPSHASASIFIRVPPRISLRDQVVRVNSPRVF